MFLKRFIQKNKSFVFCLLVAAFPMIAKAEDRELVGAINELVIELREQDFLAGAGYNAQRTDLTAALGITPKDVKQFLRNIELTRHNSASLVDSVSELGEEVKGLSFEISNLKQVNAGHSISINRNHQDIRDTRHFIGWFIVVFGSALGYLHKWLHRNDKKEEAEVE